jgi:hypothetical protein
MQLTVTEEEANQIMNALVAQPFGAVYKLVHKLDAQIKTQALAASQPSGTLGEPTERAT